MSWDGLRAGFIGGGVMATALIRAVLDRQLLRPDQISVSDPVAGCRERVAGLGVSVTEVNAEVAGVDLRVIATKPDWVEYVCREVAPSIRPGTLVMSIAAGVRLARIEAALPAGTPVVRVMPNTPALVGEGASALCRGTHATADHAALALRFLAAGGRCAEVTEPQLDAVTGLSGSGPAYVCLILEALADGGVRMGLKREVAQMLAAQTLLGTARMVLETGDHPAVWKDRVATPGGTTIAGLAELEAGGVRSALINAVSAATERSRELGQG